MMANEMKDKKSTAFLFIIDYEKKGKPKKVLSGGDKPKKRPPPSTFLHLHPFLSSTHNRFLMAGAYFLMGTDVGLLPGIVG